MSINLPFKKKKMLRFCLSVGVCILFKNEDIKYVCKLANVNAIVDVNTIITSSDPLHYA